GGEVALPLHHRQPDQRLGARKVEPPALQGVLVVESNRLQGHRRKSPPAVAAPGIGAVRPAPSKKVIQVDLTNNFTKRLLLRKQGTFGPEAAAITSYGGSRGRRNKYARRRPARCRAAPQQWLPLGGPPCRRLAGSPVDGCKSAL